MRAWIESPAEIRAQRAARVAYAALLTLTTGLADLVNKYPDEYPSEAELVKSLALARGSLNAVALANPDTPGLYADEMYSKPLDTRGYLGAELIRVVIRANDEHERSGAHDVG